MGSDGEIWQRHFAGPEPWPLRQWHRLRAWLSLARAYAELLRERNRADSEGYARGYRAGRSSR